MNFIPIAVAAQKAAGGMDIAEGRKAVLQAISQGLVPARAYRAKVTRLKFEESETDEIKGLVARASALRNSSLPFMKGCGRYAELETLKDFQSEAWAFLDATDGEWCIKRTGDEYRQDVFTDWKLGKFHRSCFSYHDKFYGGEDEIGYVLYETQCFGVEVCGESVDKMLVPHDVISNFVSESLTEQHISTIYDWESAFADVSAALYFDTEFQNVSARGVQTEIVRLLRRSFAGRGQVEPGDTILKAKAKKIQAALRSYESR